MSATIRIQSGISAGTNYWIDRPVLRIGSDPQCEICLPIADLAPHALTLEFRNGTYRAYNRGSLPVTIGDAAIQPGAAGVWGEDETAILPGDLRLVLEFDGDPRPCLRPETRLDNGFDTDGQTASSAVAAPADAAAQKNSNKKMMVQLAIIGVCGLAAAWLLLMPRAATTPAVNVPSFDAIVVNSLNKDKEIRTLVEQLQFAQAALVRGHIELSAALFLRLRDRLIRQKDSLPEADREYAQHILDYVQFRLSQFQG
ncbi:MAG TPA: hypothetical protein VHE81_03005 [Lacipirellulaceae bacterium]|nr:hypothetical protein [Lacipirellulaceae bacterium]